MGLGVTSEPEPETPQPARRAYGAGVVVLAKGVRHDGGPRLRFQVRQGAGERYCTNIQYPMQAVSRAMSDDSQILVPRSFIDLFVPPGRLKPTEPREHIAQRYELCEDLAQMLMEPAKARLFGLGITEADVLQRTLHGLHEGAVVDSAEAAWVVRRLAELLDWPPLPRD